MSETREIWCCGCGKDVSARLTSGEEVYSHRVDLYDLPFWICDSCNNFVGCHHKTKNRTQPLGVIATQEIKDARRHIHRVIDPIWKQKRMSRGALYRKLAKALDKEEYHTAQIKTIDEARKVYAAGVIIAREAS